MSDTVLITGAAGFIGSAVCRYLAMHGYTVRAATRNPAGLTDARFETVRMPDAGAPANSWGHLLENVDHVVHCAGIAHATGGIPEATYHLANAVLTGELAAAAAQRIPGKFVFMSSIRAVCGPVSQEVVTERTEPAPQDAYGRSKLEGERLVRAAFSEGGRFTVLRPVLVYGPGVKGNLAALLRLARLPLPLPLGGLSARRSLLDLEACAAAVEHVLDSPQTNGATYLVSDRNPITVAEIVIAFRRGLGRGPGIVPLPESLLAAIFAAGRHSEAWRRISGSLIGDPSLLASTGWRPVDNSLDGLERVARVARTSR